MQITCLIMFEKKFQWIYNWEQKTNIAYGHGEKKNHPYTAKT